VEKRSAICVIDHSTPANLTPEQKDSLKGLGAHGDCEISNIVAFCAELASVAQSLKTLSGLLPFVLCKKVRNDDGTGSM